MNYELKELNPNSGFLMKKDEWLAYVKSGGYIDYDGHGCLATETHCSNIIVVPSFVGNKTNKIVIYLSALLSS